jgi:adenylate cyclase
MSQTQPLCILFADVSGSTKLFEQRGDVEARRIIAAVLDALSKVCESHGGRVIKTIGDEVHLRKSGAISLGQAIGLNQQDVVYFQCSY